MIDPPTPLWQLTSEGGRQTECHLVSTPDGYYQLTVSYDGTVVTNETYGTSVQARTRATSLKEGLRTKGWVDT